MKILIIGGSSFLGPLIIQKLIKKKHQVFVFNRGTHPQPFLKKITYIKGDRDQGFKISEQFDVVIDMCSYHGAQTQMVLNQLKFSFLLHISTVAVYKKSSIFPKKESSPLGRWPVWGFYNRGKIECENILKRSNIAHASIRPTYILGPKNNINREQFIYSKIINKQTIFLPGDGQALAQFVFAKDVANSVIELALNKITGVFNCTGNEIISLEGLVYQLGKHVGVEPIIRTKPECSAERFNILDFPFANEHMIFSNDKIKKFNKVFTPLFHGLKLNFDNYYKKHL